VVSIPVSLPPFLPPACKKSNKINQNYIANNTVDYIELQYMTHNKPLPTNVVLAKNKEEEAI